MILIVLGDKLILWVGINCKKSVCFDTVDTGCRFVSFALKKDMILLERKIMQSKAKIIVSIVCTIFLFLHAITYGHGFFADTLVQLGDGSLQTIHTVCLRSLHNKISVLSYNVDASCKTNQLVKVGRRSQSNCYVRLSFDAGFNDSSCNDIVCTPMQEFYLPQARYMGTCI